MDSSIAGQSFTALILAAGKGKRIRELTDQPKCLLEFMGETLLSRHLRIWREVGIREVVLVVGYKAEMLIECIEPWKKDFKFTIVENEDPERLGNTVSLAIGLEKCQGPTLVFDADLVYEADLLSSFIASGTQSQILVGEAEVSDIECAKTLADDQGYARQTVDKRALSREELEKYEFVGEAIGILKFSSADVAKLKVNAQSFLACEENLPLNWEHLMNQFLLNNDVEVVKFNSSHRWIEIDTREDYEDAIAIFQAPGAHV